MINYKHIELTDKSQIDACLINNEYRACDFCFTNLFTWTTRFRTQFDVISNTLFLRFQELDNTYYYMMPIGPMPIPDAIKMMQQDAENKGVPFVMKGVCKTMWEDINRVMPNKFEFIHDRKNDEYIYLSERLMNLSGKKLQSKRNHINRFISDNPDWEYFPLTSQSELEECLNMLKMWEDVKEDIDKSLKYDYIATSLMLKHFDYLQLKGGAIRVNGKIVAFTIGERLTEDSFVVHVEKAFSEINGAYTIINREFVRHEASEFKYVNREEDMGIESLRKAKLSYQPDLLVEEGILIPLKR